MSSAQKTRLYHRLQIAAHRLQKAADREVLQAGGITTAQAAVLAVVRRHEPALQQQVARELGINDSAMTAMVGRLLKLGLLDRSDDDSDARAWRLSVSEQGRQAMARIDKPFRAINARIERALGGLDAQALADVLERLSDEFEQP